MMPQIVWISDYINIYIFNNKSKVGQFTNVNILHLPTYNKEIKEGDVFPGTLCILSLLMIQVINNVRVYTTYYYAFDIILDNAGI